MRRFLNGTEVALFIAFSCLSAFLLTVVYSGVSLSSENSLASYKKQYYKDQSYKLAFALQTHFNARRQSADEEERLLEQFSDVYTAGIRYYSPDKKIVHFDSIGNRRKAIDPYDVEVPLFASGDLVGYIEVQYDLNEAGDYSFYPGRGSGSLRMLLVFAGALLAALALSYALAKRLAKPLVASGRLAGQIANGSRETMLPLIGTNEMQQLAGTVNALVSDFDRQENWRKQMMQDLAHELRTPLTSLMTRIEAFIDGVYPVTAANLNKIYNEIDRLFRLVADLEKLSEAEGARFTLSMQRLDMTQLVKDVCEEFKFLASEKDVRLLFQHPHVPCYAEADPDRMIQVLSNLLSNAVKYTPAGGTVEIGLYHSADSITVFCKDNGIGISEQDAKLIFNRFYRVDKSRARESGGLGVGLSIVKALVEAHGGMIEVESSLGEGSTFYLQLADAGGAEQ